MKTPVSIRTSLSIVAAAFVLTGCAAQRQSAEFDSIYYWGEKSTLLAGASAAELSIAAVDKSTDRESRCWSTFQILGTFVKPGFTAQQMRASVPDSRWLQNCKIDHVGTIGGYIPVQYSGSVYCLRVLPDQNGWSDWTIYLRFSDEPSQSWTESQVISFLKGTYPKRDLRLKEFALGYPRPPMMRGTRVTERFTKKGVGFRVDWL